MQSPRFQLNQNDINMWLRNIGLFSTPLVIIFLTALQTGTPFHQAVLLLYGALLNALIDILKKFIGGPNIPSKPSAPVAPSNLEHLG